MESGIRKFAIVIYVGLCVYLFGQMSPNQLENRAEFLDKQLAGRDHAATVRTLAQALDMRSVDVENFLNAPEAKPSDLVFAQFLKQHGIEGINGSLREAVAKANIPRTEIAAYFDSVDRVVASSILPASNKVEVVANPKRNAGNKPLAETLRSQPD